MSPCRSQRPRRRRGMRTIASLVFMALASTAQAKHYKVGDRVVVARPTWGCLRFEDQQEKRAILAHAAAIGLDPEQTYDRVLEFVRAHPCELLYGGYNVTRIVKFRDDYVCVLGRSKDPKNCIWISMDPETFKE